MDTSTIICFVLFFGAVYCKHEAYDRHSVFEVSVQDVEQTKFLNQLEYLLHLDVWIYPTPGRSGQVLVPEQKKEMFQTELNAAGIEHRVLVENIKDVLHLEDKIVEEAASRSFNKSRVDLNFSRILSLGEVEAYLQEIAKAYPDLVTLESGGQSFEGRDIWYLRISTSNFQDRSKPIVFVQSLLHAREWITLPASLYAIHKLVVDVSENDLLQDIDWLIMPVANPDGYVFSHVDSRLWRKNRATGFPLCVGVDLNRNFDFNWGQASSSIPCSETFHGRGPFSEPETSVIRKIMSKYQDRLELYLDIHSFGSMILFGYGNGTLPHNALILNLVGVQMAQAIDAVKTSWNDNYVVGNVALILYQASGGSMDYAMSTGIPLAYTYELPGYRFGLGGLGFLVDPAFIKQAGMETWEGIKTGARYARNSYRSRNGF